VRSVVEHPVKADILAQIGAEGEDEHPEIYKHVPEWFKKGGYIPVGFDKDGNPKVINATSVNSWSSLSQFLSTAQAGFLDGSPSTKYNSTFDLLGPTAKVLVRGFTGKDDFGNDYPDADWVGAAKDVLAGLPQVTAYERGGKATSPPLKAFDVTNRKSLKARLDSGLKRTVLSPGWLDGYGALIGGGVFTPRSADKDALIARYWKDQTPEKRHQLEQDLIHRALKIQSDLLKTKLPGEVRDAIDLNSAMSWAAGVKGTEIGHTVPIGTLERTLLDIDTLVAHHRIPKDEAALLKKKAPDATTSQEQNRFHSAILYKYAGGKDLSEWDNDVRFVASFTKVNLDARLKALGSHTELKSVTASQDELYEAGRQALAYGKRIKTMRDDMKDLTHTERNVKMAELRAYIDSQDVSIKVNGKVVSPSPLRLDWGGNSPEDRAAHIRDVTTSAWGSRSNFDKELAGRKVPAKVSAAWALISQIKATYKHDNYESANAEQVLALVKQMDRGGYKGILEDYLFSRKPDLLRFELLKPYKDFKGEARRQFDRLVVPDAKKVISAIASGDYNKSDVRQAWATYVSEELKPRLSQPQYKPLRTWLEPWGPDFLASLVN
jgi:hypothetical protein